MTKTILPLRPASAAIAAVLALSSTAGFAQEIVGPPAMSAPVPTIVLPAPAPAAPAPVIVLPTQPTAPVATPEVAEAPAPRASRPAVRQAARSAPRAVAPVVRTTAPVAVPATIEPAAEIAPAEVEFAPVQTAAPADATPELDSTVATTTDSGGLGAGELGLIGGALAIGGIAAAALLARRRRRDPEPEPIDIFAGRNAAPPTPLAPKPVVARPATAQAAAPAPRPDPVGPLATDYVAPAPASLAPRRPLAAGTATGYHARQAELGPTPENPFLTRRNRMRRAHFLDAQAANGHTPAVAANEAPADDWLDAYRKEYRTAAV